MLAVSGPTRDPNAPEAPTLVKSGLPGFVANTWFALMASVEDAGRCPGENPRRCGRAMRDPVVIKRIKDIKSTPAGNTAEEFRQVIKDDLEIFRP